MKKILAIMLLGILTGAGFNAAAQKNYVPSETNRQHREEFSDMRFGVFIHWGIYSMFGQGEWYLNNGKLNAEEYAKAAGGFYPLCADIVLYSNGYSVENGQSFARNCSGICPFRLGHCAVVKHGDESIIFLIKRVSFSERFGDNFGGQKLLFVDQS